MHNSADIDVQRVSPGALSTKETAAWNALCNAQFAYRSPLLTPHFAKLVGEYREDVECALVWRDDELIGAMAYHLRPLGLARPVGAPFDDYSGPVLSENAGMTADSFLHASGLSKYRASQQIIGGRHFEANDDISLSDGNVSHVIACPDTNTSYYESRRAIYPKRFKNFRRLRNKLSREVGDPILHWGYPDHSHVDELFSWKSEQFNRDGFVDIINATDSRLILDAVRNMPENPSQPLQPFMTKLVINGMLLSGHFGIMWNGHFHPWISSYRPDFAEYAPGMMLLLCAIENMREMELTSYDLAGGHDHYKKYFANAGRVTQNTAFRRKGPIAFTHKVGEVSWSLLGAKNSQGAAARLRRRFDHIAVCERKTLPRLSEAVRAFSKRSMVGLTENGDPAATAQN